jgi:hypothetical protein
MIITIIILAYVANVFLNRWLNKIAWKKELIDILPITWFIPILSTIGYLSIFINEINPKSNWFTGKNW